MAPLLSRFLDLKIDQGLRDAWDGMSRDFESRRRPKEPLNEEQRVYLEANKDAEAEGWVLDRIEKQRRELGLYPPEFARSLTEERRLSAVKIARGRARAVQLRKRNQTLERRLRAARSGTPPGRGAPGQEKATGS